VELPVTLLVHLARSALQIAYILTHYTICIRYNTLHTYLEKLYLGLPEDKLGDSCKTRAPGVLRFPRFLRGMRMIRSFLPMM